MRTLSFLFVAFALAAGCGDPLGLPAATVENRLDTLVSLYALSGTPVTSPSAYVIAFRSTIRSDQSTSGFDFVFDIDSTGQPVLVPTGALKLGRASGLHVTTTPFDSILIAPRTPYQLDSAVAIDSNSVVLMHSRPLTCSFGITSIYYAKLHVLAIDTAARRVDFEILTNINCGYRGLEEGLPKR